ncbi:MAG TPA: Ku protein [Gemmatimonadales bacterium]|nr:Ku protein [Gemmatimonadales bacterium]
MAARPIATATVSFGLVSVPVQLYSAAESAASISFNWLHKKCGSRLKQQYVCEKDGEKVERDDMIKGYQFSKGQYVTFTPDELKKLEEQKTERIDVMEFVPLKTVDRAFLEKVYYLGADKGGERAYKLLAAALEQTGRAAIGQYAARGKQYLILVRPQQGRLVMEQLHYHNEVRAVSEVPVDDTDVKKNELALAVQLIEQLKTDEFHPEAYQDTVRQRIQSQINEKVEGREITEEPEEAPKAKIIDLMEALKASIAKGGKAGAAGSAAERKPAKRAALKVETGGAKRAPKRKASAG